MAEEKTTLTPEEMMEKINELSKRTEALEAENKNLKESNETNVESLRKAREINSELLLRIGVPEEKEPEKKPESFSDFFSDVLSKTLKKYKKE